MTTNMTPTPFFSLWIMNFVTKAVGVSILLLLLDLFATSNSMNLDVYILAVFFMALTSVYAAWSAKGVERGVQQLSRELQEAKMALSEYE